MTIERLGRKSKQSVLAKLTGINDAELRDWVRLFLLNSTVYNNFNLDTDSQIYKIVYATKQFLLAISNTNTKLYGMNWDSYCSQMHEISNTTRTADSKKVRKILQAFYLYTYNNHPSGAVKANLKPHLDYFLDSELRFDNDMCSEIYVKRMLTNFPTGATFEQLHKVIGMEGNSFSNILINTDNKLLLSLLKAFIDDYATQDIRTKKLLTRNSRAFFYYFEDGLDKDIQQKTDFSRETFIQQFNYFNTFTDKPHMNDAITLLKVFYLFLDKDYYTETSNWFFTSPNFNRTLLTNGWFTKYLSEGYEIIYRSRHEEIPSSDKLVVVRREKDKKSMGAYSNVILDFTGVENEEFRQELKQYLWYLDIDDKYLQRKCSEITNFLNYTQEFSKTIVDFHGKKTPFSSELILGYIAWVKSRENEKGELLDTGTVNLILGSVRQYLQHRPIKNKYKINDLTIGQIKLAKVDSKETANPMSKKDFEAISKVFRNKKQSGEPNAELFFIIFKLSVDTKLRKGEVINLKTDCIISKHEKYGIIEYIPKTEKEPVQEELLIEDILLIEKAIELTQNCRLNTPNDLKKYIFISFRTQKHKSEVTMLGQHYDLYFNRIIGSLYKQREISKVYTPYHSRHTYIDGIYQMAEDNLISTTEATAMAGNSPKIAAKHYRERNVVRYLEATYMVTIGDVDINGQVIENDNEIKNLQEVEQGAGGCKSDDCIKKEVDEDTGFKCLTCNKFVTSLSRTKVFEDRLKRYTEFRETTSSIMEQDYYNSLCELYGKYLAALYSLMEMKS